MTINNLLVLTSRLGFKSVMTISVDVTYHVEIVPNDFCVDLLGDTCESIVFDSFKVNDGALPMLVNEYGKALDFIQDMVRDYIRTGDTLTKGAGLLGAHQTCYVIGSVAHDEHLRCLAFQARQRETMRA